MRQRERGGSPVLLEMLLVTLLLALSATVLVQLLAAAARVSRETARDERAGLALQDGCETLRAALLSGASGDTAALWYDEDFLPVPAAAAVYRLDTALTPTAMAGGVYYDIALTVSETQGGPLSELRAGVYVPEAAA